MKTTINVLFKSMQKDDKKEVLKFEIKGSEDVDGEANLFDISGSIVVLSIKGCVVGDITAEFISIQRDSKKTAVKFGLKGDSEERANQLYKFAGRNVELTVAPSQMSIDEFEESHQGVRSTQNGDGTIDLDNEEDEEQVTIDEVMKGVDETPPSNVTSLTGKQTKKQKEEAAKLVTASQIIAEAQQNQDVAVNETPLPFSDDPDDLPL